MTTIYSEAGTTVTRRYRDPPTKHWVQDTPTTGHYEPADVAHGYYPLVETPPVADSIKTVERQGDTFVEVWTFDQALADQNAAEAADAAERAQIANAIGTLDTIVDNADTLDTAQIRNAVGYLAKVCRRLVKDQYE